MKYLLSLAITIFSVQAYAQQLNGQALDRFTKQPAVNAVVIYGNQRTQTAMNGKFKLTRIKGTEKIIIRHMGYQPYEIMPGQGDSVLIYLTPISIDLSDVTVSARKDYTKAIQKLQKEYADMETYEKPILGNVLVEKGLRDKSDFAGLVSNSTSSIATVDLLRVVNLFKTKKTDSTTLQKTQKILEDQQYIEKHFSAETVTSITGLKGDALKNFIQKYRPPVSEIRKMNDYEIMTYIKQSFTEFKKPD